MACSILGPWQSHVQHWLVNLLVGWVLQPLRLPPLPGLASSGVRMLLDVCCCMATPSIQSSGMWAFSENTTQRLLLKFQPYGQNVWADYIQCLGCMELRSLQCCDDHSKRWMESRLLLHKTWALSWQWLWRIWKCWNWIYSQFQHHLSESTGNGISRGESSYKTNGFLLSLCQDIINFWCWRCSWVT